MPFIYPHLALMPDAHLGKGATVGSVIPTLGAIMPAAVGVDIGCGMIAVRTQFTRRRPARAGPLASCASHRGGGAAVGRALQHDAHARRAAARVDELEELAARAGFDPAAYAGNWRLQLGTLGRATTSSRSPSTRRTGSGCSCTPARAGSATGSPASHRGRPGANAGSGGSTLPDRDLAYLVEGTESSEPYIERAAVGAAVRAAQPRGDDGPGRRLLRGWLGAAGRASEDGSTATTTTPSGRRTSARRSGCPARARSMPRGQAGLIPGSMGTASYVVAGKGNPPSLNSVAARRGPRYSRTRGAQDVHPRRAARGHDGHRVPRHRRVPRRDPRGLQGHRRGHGRRGTWSRSGTRCARSSTSRATDRGAGSADGGAAPLPRIAPGGPACAPAGGHRFRRTAPDAEWMGWPIRRVLSSRAVAGAGVAAIHLRTPLPTPSSGLPGHSGEQPSIMPCLALLRVGFT